MPELNRGAVEAKKITHIGIVVHDRDKTIEKYSKMFGWGPWHTETFAPPALSDTIVRGRPTHYTMKMAMTMVDSMNSPVGSLAGKIGFEVIEPDEGRSIYHEFLKKKGEGLHHIGYYDVESTEDLKKALDAFEKMGVKVLQSGKYRDETRESEFYYMDTESLFGVVCETRRFGRVTKGETKGP